MTTENQQHIDVPQLVREARERTKDYLSPTPLEFSRYLSDLTEGEVWLKLDLVQNPDILEELGRIKKDKLLVGFCAETSGLKEKAKEKLEEKNLDLIVANDITLEGAGFGGDTNIVLLIDRDGEVTSLDRRSKREVARKIWDKVKELMPT